MAESYDTQIIQKQFGDMNKRRMCTVGGPYASTTTIRPHLLPIKYTETNVIFVITQQIATNNSQKHTGHRNCRESCSTRNYTHG